MAHSIRTAALLLSLLLLGSACATKRPILYPDARARPMADADVERCLASAAAHGHEARPALRSAGGALAGGAIGGAAGAAWGAVRGDAGLRAGAGAAAGAAAGLVRGLLKWREPDPIQARFVSICLGDDGYRVIGWK